MESPNEPRHSAPPSTEAARALPVLLPFPALTCDPRTLAFFAVCWLRLRKNVPSFGINAASGEIVS